MKAKFVSWLNEFKIYKTPRVAGMLFFGFSAGLPLALLVLGTLSFWLREAGIDRATIGYFSWIGLAYAFKWVWSPLVDRAPLPFLTGFLGRRRAWLLLSQIVLAACFVALAFSDPAVNLNMVILFALIAAFASATQDIALDAYRIEAVEEKLQGAMAAAYQTGYRLAMMTATAGALAIAQAFDPDDTMYQHYPWLITYTVMASLMSVGIITTLVTPEPVVNRGRTRAFSTGELVQFQHSANIKSPAFARFILWLKKAVYEPFADFIIRYRRHAIMLLLIISSYRISDIVLGVMANPFYVDMGFTKGEVASISKVFGVIMTLIGAAVGGVLVATFGVIRILFVGALTVALTNTLFAYLATVGHSIPWLTFTIAFDNLSAGIAGTAFIAYLSSLTSVSYTATQYALFTSMMLLFPKFLAGFSGEFVDAYGYVSFFLGASALGIPVLVLILMSSRYQTEKKIN